MKSSAALVGDCKKNSEPHTVYNDEWVDTLGLKYRRENIAAHGTAGGGTYQSHPSKPKRPDNAGLTMRGGKPTARPLMGGEN